MSEEEVKPTTWHRNPFDCFKDEILKVVILPKILMLLEGDTIDSKLELLKKFKDTYNSTVSMTTFEGWLVALGITFKRVTQIKLPEGMSKPIERSQPGAGMAIEEPQELPPGYVNMTVDQANKLFD